MSRIQNSFLNNNQMATSKVLESGIFFVSTTQQGTGVNQSAYESKNIPVRYTKNVDQVTLVFTSDSTVRNVVANNVRYESIPEDLRPIDPQVIFMVLGTDDDNPSYPNVSIQSDGQIVIGGQGATPSPNNPFVAGTNILSGPYSFTITYYTGN